MDKQEWHCAVESGSVNICLGICIALFITPRSAAVRSCVSTGSCGQPATLLPTWRHCGAGTGWSLKSLQTQTTLWFVCWSGSCSEGGRAPCQPIPEVWPVLFEPARSMGWDTDLGPLQKLFLLQTNHAVPAKPLCSPLTSSCKLLILNKLVPCCWPR